MNFPYLEWFDRNSKKHHLKIIDRIFVGRICKGIENDKRIIVDDPTVSRIHAEISLIGPHLLIRDLSKNGTWVNNLRLTAGSTNDLKNTDLIQIGSAAISVICPGLDAHNEDDTNFSTSTDITYKEVLTTNLVADVRNFSVITEQEKSERTYTLMKEIIGKFTAIIHEHKGTVKDLAGDAIYAFWEHEKNICGEKAELACQAAIKQVETANKIKQELFDFGPAAQNLKLGWGVATGKITMSHYGFRATDLALVGESTNLAFRLAEIANKELSIPIVICSYTAALIKDKLMVEELGPVNLKGRSEKECVFGIGHGC